MKAETLLRRIMKDAVEVKRCLKAVESRDTMNGIRVAAACVLEAEKKQKFRLKSNPD